MMEKHQCTWCNKEIEISQNKTSLFCNRFCMALQLEEDRLFGKSERKVTKDLEIPDGVYCAYHILGEWYIVRVFDNAVYLLGSEEPHPLYDFYGYRKVEFPSEYIDINLRHKWREKYKDTDSLDEWRKKRKEILSND